MPHKSQKCAKKYNATHTKNDIKDDKVLLILLEYLKLPLLPYNSEITIHQIGAYNWNYAGNYSSDIMKYSMLSSIDVDQFPPNSLNYNISPIVIVDINKIKYRPHHKFWSELAIIHSKIINKQCNTKSQIFPTTIFIDASDNWVNSLKNLSN